MAAQWPVFINNVSSKMSSRSSTGPDEFGKFIANEYYNAVKTSQTTYGNIHISGNKAILENGFKKAFNDLFKIEATADDFKDPSTKYMPAYNTMAKCIIDYWKSTTSLPFNSTPPVPPCTIPVPGTYIPISYGNQSKLGIDLQKAWTSGKSAQSDSATNSATQKVASEVSIACASHLSELKFTYIGSMMVGVAVVPATGQVSSAF